VALAYFWRKVPETKGASVFELPVPGVSWSRGPLVPRLVLPRAGSGVPLAAVIAGHPGGGPGKPTG
jgi:hypothetical protein